MQLSSVVIETTRKLSTKVRNYKYLKTICLYGKRLCHFLKALFPEPTLLYNASLTDKNVFFISLGMILSSYNMMFDLNKFL